ncbi:MAG: type II toxin-antitoxin system VapC family toxin [Spirochaetes bacterium]|nr:type II toxin-antitoxin system VapC family toxin [Spirochaetota bacterium]
MIWVLDCSFFAALFLPDEKSESVKTFFRNNSNQLNVPSLFWYEITNVLAISLNRKSLNESTALIIFNLIDKFDISTDTIDDISEMKEIFHLCGEYQLSSYDASYLELSIRKNASLASLDNNLNSAAKKLGINIYK